MVGFAMIGIVRLDMVVFVCGNRTVHVHPRRWGHCQLTGTTSFLFRVSGITLVCSLEYNNDSMVYKVYALLLYVSERAVSLTSFICRS